MAISVITAYQRLGVHPLTIRKAIKDGRLRATNIAPAHWPRPRWRIEEEDFAAFAEKFMLTYKRRGPHAAAK